MTPLVEGTTKRTYILGAGFSHAFFPKMPLLPTLSAEVQQIVRSDSELAAKSSRYGCDNNIETLLTAITEELPWLSEVERYQNKAYYVTLAETIRRLIAAEEEMIRPSSAPALVRLVGQWADERATVITLNYDTLIERVAHHLKLGYLTSLYPIPLTSLHVRTGVGIWGDAHQEGFQLYKLHGSLNWHYSRETSFAGQPIYYSPLKEAREDEDALELPKLLAGLVPLVLPPTFNKSIYVNNETIKALWQRASRALSDAEEVFVIGYSLPETDLMMRYFLLSGSPRQRVPLHVVNPDRRCVEHFRRLLDAKYEVSDRYATANWAEQLLADLSGTTTP